MPEMPNHQSESAQKAKKTKELTDSMRKLIVVTIAQQSEDGAPPRGIFSEIAQMVGVHWSTVMRLWNDYGLDASQAISIPAINFLQRGDRGRKCVFFPGKSLVEHIRSIPVSQCRTVEDLAVSLEISNDMMHHLVKEGGVCKHSSTLKPSLTEENKLLRIAWCYDHIDCNTGHYCEMLDIVHVDEKWFNLTELTKACYFGHGRRRSLPHCLSQKSDYVSHVSGSYGSSLIQPKHQNLLGWKNWHLGVC